MAVCVHARARVCMCVCVCVCVCMCVCVCVTHSIKSACSILLARFFYMKILCVKAAEFLYVSHTHGLCKSVIEFVGEPS